MEGGGQAGVHLQSNSLLDFWGARAPFLWGEGKRRRKKSRPYKTCCPVAPQANLLPARGGLAWGEALGVTAKNPKRKRGGSKQHW